MTGQTPDDYYREKAKEARRLYRELQKARKRGDPPEVLRKLNRRLELAYYTGD